MKWNFPRWCLNPWLHTSLLFILPILLASALQPWLTSYSMEKRFTQDLDNIATDFASGLDGFEQHSVELAFAELSFSCDSEDIALLNSPSLSPAIVRFIQLELADGRQCSNIGPPVHYQFDRFRSLFIDSQLVDIATTVAANDRARSIAYIFHLGEQKLVVLTNSSVYNETLSTLCHGCYQLMIGYQGLSSLERGVEDLLQTQTFIEDSRYISVLDVTLTLRAGDELYWREASRIGVVLFISALIVAFLTVIFYWNWQSARVSMGMLIQKGISRKEFIPYYQPIIDCRSGEVVGQEMLVRWRRFDGVLVQPNQFIPYAEDSGLILPITDLILEQVYQDLPQLKGWVSVNIVAQHLESGLLSQWFSSHPDPRAKRISFELTERKPITQFELALAEMKAVTPLCHDFKLDDFGTGFGGFSYLQRLGINSIKIDKMFTYTIGTQDLKGAVLDAIIAFGRESQMDMVAEGVETQAQVEYLAAKGVYQHQGYFYAKPLAFEDLLTFYQNLSNKK
ncbi:EAL domain-containing protein [Shewanella mangrovisoli]|uniref:EAL domain-containing protein n=1 Tax=Shewanella mangrovisoli TaxID=2864211 RepID=UPI0035BACBDA